MTKRISLKQPGFYRISSHKLKIMVIGHSSSVDLRVRKYRSDIAKNKGSVKVLQASGLEQADDLEIYIVLYAEADENIDAFLKIYQEAGFKINRIWP